SRWAVQYSCDHQHAMRNIGIIARVLDNTRTCEVLAKLRQGQREGWPRTTWKLNRDRIGKFSADERFISRTRGGGRAGPRRPAPAQLRLWGSVFLGTAHRAGNAFS